MADDIRGDVRVIDGDTIVVGGQRVRIEGLHAPELNEPFGQQARDFVIALLAEDDVRCVPNGRRSYNRVVARCFLVADGSDLAARLVAAGLGRDCARFSGGRYADLEPAAAAAMPLPGYCVPR
ncbi:MAG: thermonuclease family protein [Geminicoccaceae bacterium]|nr:MAG: thermonuclease family protein [Geminicoccaceae bacterium]